MQSKCDSVHSVCRPCVHVNVSKHQLNETTLIKMIMRCHTQQWRARSLGFYSTKASHNFDFNRSYWAIKILKTCSLYDVLIINKSVILA